MIPAAVRCPYSDWVLEYKGYVNVDTHADAKTVVTEDYYKTSHICADQAAESLTSQPGDWSGSPIYLARAQCTGAGALGSCQPYKSGKALSCVVCTK